MPATRKYVSSTLHDPLVVRNSWRQRRLIPAHSAALSARYGDAVEVEASLGHHLLQIAEAEPKPQVPTDAQVDDLGFEMSSLKIVSTGSVASIAGYQTRSLPACNTSV